MSFRHLNWAYEVPDLTAGEKAVLVYLANRADKLGRCYPGVQDIARRTSQSPSSVHRAKRSLLEKGLVSIAVGGGRGRANIYQLHLDIGEACQSDAVSREKYAVTVTENPVTQTQNPASVTVNPATVTPHTSLTTMNHHEPSDEKTTVWNVEQDVKTKRQRQVPENFAVTERLMSLGRSLGLADDEIKAEIDAFKDHEFRHPKTNWTKAASNWLRTEAKRRTSSKPVQELTYSERIRRATQDTRGESLFSEVPRLVTNK